MENCEHEFEETEDKSYHLSEFCQTLEKNVVCSKCGKTGKEIWVYSTTEED